MYPQSKASAENVCTMMARAIAHIAQDVETDQNRLRGLEARLRTLQAQSNPDPEQIRQLQEDIEEWEDQLDRSRSQLAAFQEEHRAACGPESTT
jgi:septal ring factor EnvC (AmiA/AmiB activator)